MQKKKIVFVSGVFDVIHYGHIDFLMRAKDLVNKNGKLIVAIHDDESIRLHKGEGRPVNCLHDRVKVIEAVRYVDQVIPWIGWENIEELVKKIKPDYIAVSGNEYKRKSISRIAKEIGAKLVVFPKIACLSTTEILAKCSAQS